MSLFFGTKGFTVFAYYKHFTQVYRALLNAFYMQPLIVWKVVGMLGLQISWCEIAYIKMQVFLKP